MLHRFRRLDLVCCEVLCLCDEPHVRAVETCRVGVRIQEYA